jgi:hypothetical protein
MEGMRQGPTPRGRGLPSGGVIIDLPEHFGLVTSDRDRTDGALVVTGCSYTSRAWACQRRARTATDSACACSAGTPWSPAPPDPGKGSALWSPIQAMAAPIRAGVVEPHGIDRKRMELVFAPELFTRLTAGSPADAARHLEELAAGMTARQDRLAGKAREHIPTRGDRAVVVVIDELAALTAYCTDRDAKRRVEAALSLLLSQGRAVGVLRPRRPP